MNGTIELVLAILILAAAGASGTEQKQGFGRGGVELEFEETEVEDADPELMKALYDTLEVIETDTEKLVGEDFESLRVTQYRPWGKKARYTLVTTQGGYVLFVFKHTGEDVSYVDHTVQFQKYGPPEWYIAEVQGQVFLVLEILGTSGTGCIEYYHEWYSIGEEGMRPVLKIIAEGDVSGWANAFNRKFDAIWRIVGDGSGEESVAYFHTARYWRPDQDGPYGSASPVLERSYETYFDWDAKVKMFRLNPRYSTATPDRLQRLFKNANDGFVEDNIQALRQMRLTEERTLWLMELIRGCSKTKNIQALSRILLPVIEPPN